MSSIDIKEKELFQKWAEKNSCNRVFENEEKKDSYFVERTQDSIGIWNYQFSTSEELKNMISEISGSDMEPELEKLIVISALKCKSKAKEQDCANSDDSIADYIYVF